MRILQAYVSSTLEQTFGENFRHKYGLSKYHDTNAPSVFFGLYRLEDINLLIEHKGFSLIVWGGADMRDSTLEIAKPLIKSNRAATLAFPGEFSNTLTKFSIPHKSLYFAIKDYSSLLPTALGDKIYVYRGIKGSRAKYFQWDSVISPLIDQFGEDKVIFTENLGFDELVKSYYSKAFIYVKPTPKGGCTSMIELGCMGIRTVGSGHSTFPSFITYKNLSHLFRIIENESKKIGQIQRGVSESTFKILDNSDWLNTDFWKQ